MSKQEFKEILEKVRNGEEAELIRTVEGVRYVRRFEPAERLILLGGGHVALAVAKIASLLGFSVIVVDDRPEFASKERFPMASRVLCDSFDRAIEELGLRPTDYLCTLTRGHTWDALCLQAIRESGVLPKYLGMLGSKRRAEGVRQKLLGDSAGLLEILHAPIGVPIGALTAEEIAVSVCAELVQERRKDQKNPKADCLVQTGVDEAALKLLADPERQSALLLVLQTEGETPLKPGALMAVDRFGRGYGTVGGGRAEAMAMQQAMMLMETGGQRVLTVDLTADMAGESAGISGGIMRILTENVR